MPFWFIWFIKLTLLSHFPTDCISFKYFHFILLVSPFISSSKFLYLLNSPPTNSSSWYFPHSISPFIYFSTKAEIYTIKFIYHRMKLSMIASTIYLYAIFHFNLIELCNNLHFPLIGLITILLFRNALILLNLNFIRKLPQWSIF